jgi:hypothetical protein
MEVVFQKKEQIRAGSGHFGSQQPNLVLVSCEIGSDLGSRIKFFFPKFQSPFGSGTT